MPPVLHPGKRAAYFFSLRLGWAGLGWAGESTTGLGLPPFAQLRGPTLDPGPPGPEQPRSAGSGTPGSRRRGQGALKRTKPCAGLAGSAAAQDAGRDHREQGVGKREDAGCRMQVLRPMTAREDGLVPWQQPMAAWGGHQRRLRGVGPPRRFSFCVCWGEEE